MPPRKARRGAKAKGGSTAAGGTPAGSLFGKKKGKAGKKKRPPFRTGGLVPTLGWLWGRTKDGIARALHLRPPAEVDEEDADDGDENKPIRALPAFIRLNIHQTSEGDLTQTGTFPDSIEISAAPHLTVREARLQLRTILAQWQSLIPTKEEGEAASRAQEGTEKEDSAKKKQKDRRVTLAPPAPQLLMTGRTVWADATRLGSIINRVGGGYEEELEFLRYGPVRIMLGTADLGASGFSSQNLVSHAIGRQTHLLPRAKEGELLKTNTDLLRSAKRSSLESIAACSPTPRLRSTDERSAPEASNEFGWDPPKLPPLGFAVKDPFVVKPRRSVAQHFPNMIRSFISWKRCRIHDIDISASGTCLDSSAAA
jgi:hypothetical protein